MTQSLTTLVMSPFIGAFLAVLICRLPSGAPIVVARSRCEACARVLSPLELIPLLSWVALNGRCRTCRAPIGFLAPGMEIAALLVAIWAVLAAPSGLVAPTAALGWTLLTLSVIDAREMILPNVLTLPLIAAGLALSILAPGGDPVDAVIGALVGGLTLWGVAEGYRAFRGVDGLGLGDAKLFAGAGAWLGWAALPSVLLFAAASAIAAALVMRAFGGAPLSGKTEIPFGPFLAAGFWLVWLYGPLA